MTEVDLTKLPDEDDEGAGEAFAEAIKSLGTEAPSLGESRQSEDEGDASPEATEEATEEQEDPTEEVQLEDGQDKDDLPYVDLKERYRHLQGALKQERGFRKDERATNAKLSERMTRILDMATQRAADDNEFDQQQAAIVERQTEEKEYAPEVRQIADLVTKRVQQDLAPDRERAARERDQSERQQQVAAISGFVKSDRENFIQVAEDFQKAEEFLRDSRLEEIKRDYPEATEQQVAAAFIREVAQKQVQFARAGRSLSKWVYESAKARGYAPSAAEGNVQPVEGSPSKRLSRIDSNVKGARKLGEARGGTISKAPMEIKALLDLSDEEFDDQVQRMGGLTKVAKKFGHEVDF